MPLAEFWHGDLRLLTAYEKAYFRDVSYRAWWTGMYGQLAVSQGVNNAFAKSDSQRAPFPKYEDVVQKVDRKRTITKQNLEIEFRKQMTAQNEWLRQLMK